MARLRETKILVLKAVFAFFLPILFLEGGTKNILLIDLDGSGSPGIILEKTDNSYDWYRNNMRAAYLYQYRSYNYSYSYPTSSSGNLYSGIRLFPEQSITFLDQNLANLIHSHADSNYWWRNANDPAYQPAALSTTQLGNLSYLSDNGTENIQNISGIENLSNLTYLRLDQQSLSDPSPIWNLKQLQSLSLSGGGKITDISGISSLANLRNLDLSGQRLTDLSPLANLSNLLFLDLQSNFIDLSDSQTKSIIQGLRNNGTWVDVEPQLPVSAQNLSNQMVLRESQITVNQDDPKANFVYGFELLLELIESKEATSLKQIAIDGGASTTLIDFVLPDFWRYDLGYEDNSTINAYADLNQMEGYLENVFIPRLTKISSHFLKMASQDAVVQLTQDLTGSEELINVDKGDAYLMMALVEALKGFGQILVSYDWDYNMQTLEKVDGENLLNLEALLDNSKTFFQLKAQNQLNTAKASLKQAVTYYKLASDIMRTRLNQEMLFKMSSSDLADDDEMRKDLDDFVNSLDNKRILDDNTSNTIDLNALFTSKLDPISMIPPVVGDKFESDDFPDPTFGGLMPNWNKSILRQKLIEESLLSEDMLEGSVAIKGAPNWNRSNWLGSFYIPAQPSKTQFWMFHMDLHWVYFNGTSPSNVWLYLEKEKDWLWTKKSIYPNLYSNNFSLWFYMQPNGSFMQWANNRWSNR
jgi:hypothetical protein